jgi:hypothetical protein
MSETNETSEQSESKQQGGVDYTQKGVMDRVSYLYVLGGIPCMVIFFVVLFSLVGTCDASNTFIPA